MNGWHQYGTHKAHLTEHCIKQFLNEDKRWVSWCGRVLPTDWYFQSIDHAILSEEKLSTVGIPCPACLRIADERLEKIR